MEHKRFTANLELKDIGESGTFEGYASVFDVEDSDGDVIVKGAFANTINNFTEKGKMPKMLWQHNPSIIIGKFTEMLEDNNGLYVKGRLITEVDKGREAHILMKEGALDSMSVGFNIIDAVNTKGRGRTINDLDLWEVSLVTWGANPDALVSTVKGIDTERDFEKFLRDSGFSRKEATAITCYGYKNQSESDYSNDLTNLINIMRK